MSINTYELDVSDFKEGSDYQLKLEANDGISDSSKTINLFVDNTRPEISVEPLQETVFREIFVLEARGKAFDGLSGIEFVEFSVDDEHWFKALVTNGFLKKEASFKIKQKLELEDGTYDIGFRAIDVAGNLSEIKSQQIIIDKSPPRIGSYTLSRGNTILFPEGDSFKLLPDSKIRLTISLEQDTKEATLSVNDKKFSLTKNKAVGLWESDVTFSEENRFIMKISAKDLVDNIIENKEIGMVELIKPGKISSIDGNQVIEKAKITVLAFDEDNRSYVKWQAGAYGLKNPISANKVGEYDLLLPPGKYQLLIQKTGFKKLKSSEFEILNSQFVNFDFQLNKRRGIRGFFEDVLDKILIF